VGGAQWRKRVGRAIAVSGLLAIGWFASAQTAPPSSPCADYVAAAQWDASVSFDYAHVAQDANGKVDLSADATGAAILPRVPDPFPGISIPQWTGLAQGSGFVHDILTDFTTPQPESVRMDGAGGLQTVASSNASIIFLDLDPTACTYSFIWTPAVDVTITTKNGAGSPFVDAIGSVQSDPRPLPAVVPNQPLAPLTGNASFAATGGFTTSGDRYTPERLLIPLFLPGQIMATHPSSAAVRWSFDPNVEALELVIDPQNYGTWMPQGYTQQLPEDYAQATPGLVLEDEIGNSIDVTATVRRKADGLPPQNSSVLFIEFTLTQTSAEPGIALNTPPQGLLANPQPKDLQFDPLKNAARNPVVVVSPGDTSAARAAQGVGNTATAVVSAYDWGAFGVIEARATMSTGAQLIGHLITDPTMQQVRLPKRDATSHIADEWKRQHGKLGVGDSVDDEDNPGGDGTELGDGLSLYEEYRGFFVEGFQFRGFPGRETDPNKKDLFVKNDYSPALVPGFKLLAEHGKLNVHYELLEQEIDAGSVVNFNHGQGAHAIDQHGVRVRLAPPKESGGLAVEDPNQPGTNRLLPRSTVHVWVTPLIFRNSEGTLEVDRDSLADVTAHEVSHAISVEHHGETDLRNVKWSLDPLTGEVTETSRLGSYPIEIRTEDGCPGGCALMPAELREFFFPNYAEKQVYVANFRGEHSGRVDCVMRYEAASAYTHEPTQQSTPRVRWWKTGEPAGTALDGTVVGSAFNAAARGPRSRYGDACSGLDRGDCRHHIRVSDALLNAARSSNNGMACP
jgi:hypothetical protein